MDVTTFNIRTCGELAVEYGAEGLLLTDWGDNGHPQFGVWSMVPCALNGQYGWNIGKMQDGESFKADFIHASEDFVDEYAFEGKKVSRLMYRMANYYLLEPERVHVCTMCAKQLSMPMSVTKYAHLFDLKDSGDDFYFDNVTDYVSRVMADIEKIDFDERMKREIRFTALLIELGSEVCKVKLNPEITKEKADALVKMLDLAMEEYEELWNARNYEKGIDKFMSQLKGRKEEILQLV